MTNDFDVSQPDAEQLLWEHDLVVTEVSRRERDLDRLATAVEWEAAVAAVRAEAAGVSALPLDRLRH